MIPTRGAGFLGGGQAIDELESLWMQWAYWCVRDVGYNQHVISLADSRNTGSISNSRPIKDAHSR